MKKKGLNVDASLPLLEKFDNLSKLKKVLICVGLFIVVAGAFVWFLYLPKFEKIGKLKEEYAKLEKELVTVQKKAAELKHFKAEMAKAEEDFRLARKKLPENQEIPDLLASISRSGQDTGLEFLLFQPKAEVKKDFYAEIPVAIKVLGSYHNNALFFDKVSKLNRIVNIENIVLVPEKDGDTLENSCTALTYKYIEEPVKKESADKKKSKRRGR